MDIVVYVYEQRMARSDYMEVHAELRFHCSHDIRTLFPRYASYALLKH